MIITLKGADFSSNKIGVLSSWTIFTTLGTGATYSGSKLVDKNGSLSATVTIADGYELGSAGVSVIMGTTDISSGAAIVNGNTITISIATVTGNVTIKVPTLNTSTGEEDGNEENINPITLATLHENSQFAGTGTGLAYNTTDIVADLSNTYFIYENIPVEANTEYVLEKGRACWFLDSNKNPIAPTATNYVNLTTAYNNFTFNTPANCAYITVAFKYADIQPANVNILKHSFGEPITTLLKDTGAIYMAETGIVSQSSNPNTYTQPQSVAGYFTYHLIPVTGGNKYKMENCRLSNWYDSNKQFIKQVNFNVNTSNPQTSDWSLIAPINAAYLSICVNNNDSTKDTVAMIEYPKV